MFNELCVSDSLGIPKTELAFIPIKLSHRGPHKQNTSTQNFQIYDYLNCKFKDFDFYKS